jgi:hypothetical protein
LHNFHPDQQLNGTENPQPATIFSKAKSYLGSFGNLLLIAWGEAYHPSHPKGKRKE